MDIEILNEERLRYWCSRIDIPDGAAAELQEIAGQIRSDQHLLEIFTSFYQDTVVPRNWHSDEEQPMPFHPDIIDRYGEAGVTMFYLLAYMAALPAVEQEYIRRGIDLQIFHDTLLDIRIWLLRAKEQYGDWRFKQFGWIAGHLNLELFRLGRLQFALREYDDYPTALRHRQTGEVRLLCGPEIALRPDGYALGSGQWEYQAPPEGEGWHAVFEECEDGWRGNLISPYGYVLRDETFLPRAEWEIALRIGDTLLDIHIPRGEKMTMEACGESLERAFAFFAVQAPDRPIRAGFCHTWFFTPQLQQFHSLDSNIVRFQREFYLYPYEKGGPSFLWDYVFGLWNKDPQTAPRGSALQRATLDWIAQGGELFDLPGLMFHGPKEWGSQPYFRQWEAAHGK